MIIKKPWRRLCRRIFAISRIAKRKVCQTGRLKDLIILNRRRKVSYLTTVLGIITDVIFLIKISKGIKVIHTHNPNGQRNEEPINNHGNYTKNNERKESIKCWECNGPHYASV